VYIILDMNSLNYYLYNILMQKKIMCSGKKFIVIGTTVKVIPLLLLIVCQCRVVVTYDFLHYIGYEVLELKSC